MAAPLLDTSAAILPNYFAALASLQPITNVNRLIQNSLGVGSWAVTAFETEGAAFGQASIEAPPGGSPAEIGNGALRLFSPTTGTSITVEGSMYAGPTCAILSAATTLLGNTASTFMGLLQDVTSFTVQVYAVAGTVGNSLSDITIRLRVADNPNPYPGHGGPPETVFNPDEDLTDLIFIPGVNPVSASSATPTTGEWITYTMNANQGNWFQRRRARPTTCPVESPSPCPDTYAARATVSGTNATGAYPNGPTLGFFQVTGQQYRDQNGCVSVGFSANTRVVSVTFVINTGSPGEEFYIDNPTIRFKNTTFVDGVGPTSVGTRLMTLSTNFELYPKVTLAASMPGPLEEYDPTQSGNAGRR